MQYLINGVELEVILDDEKMSTYGIPNWYPSAGVDKSDGKPVVYITSAFTNLSKKTQDTLLGHEVGHVACGHLDLPEAQTDNLVINAQLEAEADAWVARILGIGVFDTAMREIAKASIDAVITNVTGVETSDVSSLIYAEINQRKANYMALM